MNKSEQLCFRLIFCGIIFTPITSLLINGKEMGMISEISNVFLFISFFIFAITIILNKKKIFFPADNIMKYLILFYIFILLSGIFNVERIYTSKYASVLGIERFFKISFGIYAYFLIYIFLYNIFYKYKGNVLIVLKDGLIISFVLAVFYSIFEIGGGFLGIGWMLEVMEYADSIIHPQLFVYRLRSVCLEPSFFAFFAALVFPWLVSSILTIQTKAKYIFMILSWCMLVMVVLTTSRSAYFMIGLECLFVFCNVKKYLHRRLFIPVMMLFLAVYLLIEYFSYELEYSFDLLSLLSTLFNLESESNLARYGMAASAYNLFLDNPWFGVGLGQFVFRFGDSLPDFAYSSSEVVSCIVGTASQPMVHSLYARLLGEVGICGFLTWIMLWVYAVYRLVRCYCASKDNNMKVLIGNFIICHLMLMFNWYSWDSMTNFIIWVFLAMDSVIIKKYGVEYA